MKKYILALLMVGMLTSPVFATKIEDAVSIDEIQTKVGEKFSIPLDSNPTTGYAWQAKIDSSYLSLLGQTYSPGQPQLLGSGGKEVFEFQALQQGNTKITFSYARPWESQPPAQTKEYTIIVTSSVINDCWYGDPVILKQGVRGDDVKQLQSLLSEDKTIYPQGIITGYFGIMTQGAVKRLQQKVGLPQTGIVDDNTRPIIFPCIKVRVTYPNGGESFKVGGTMKISYEVEMPSYQILKPESNKPIIQQVLPSADVKQNTTYSEQIIRPVPQTLSIDLVEAGGKCIQVQCFRAPCPPICDNGGSRVVFHIRNISLNEKGNNGSIEWNIPNTIPESSNYKIRISAGNYPDTRCPDLPGLKCIQSMPANPNLSWRVFDESDSPFTILGGLPQTSVTPIPTMYVTPMPTSTIMPSTIPVPDKEYLVHLRDNVLEMIQKLQSTLDQINKLLGL